jgi:hypothetical protein
MAENETEVWISPRKAKYIANQEAFLRFLMERDESNEEASDG